MTEAEKFYFKVLQWIIALGTTLLLFGMGYLISFGVSMWTWQQKHDFDTQTWRENVIRRMYVDSINYNEMDKRIVEIETKLKMEALEVGLRPPLEAYIREEKPYKPPKK